MGLGGGGGGGNEIGEGGVEVGGAVAVAGHRVDGDDGGFGGRGREGFGDPCAVDFEGGAGRWVEVERREGVGGGVDGGEVEVW